MLLEALGAMLPPVVVPAMTLAVRGRALLQKEKSMLETEETTATHWQSIDTSGAQLNLNTRIRQRGSRGHLCILRGVGRHGWQGCHVAPREDRSCPNRGVAGGGMTDMGNCKPDHARTSTEDPHPGDSGGGGVKGMKKSWAGSLETVMDMDVFIHLVFWLFCLSHLSRCWST